MVETLDQRGLWEPHHARVGPIRCLPQRNAYHRFTVDRHLCEAAANAAALVDRVDRPDLLVVGTLLHDIGKGRPGDHTEVGIEMVADIGPRMGFGPQDTLTLQQMVRHHLLLPDVATRRDLSDDGTLAHVADAVGDLTTLRLLDALTEADSHRHRHRGLGHLEGRSWSGSSSTRVGPRARRRHRRGGHRRRVPDSCPA